MKALQSLQRTSELCQLCAAVLALLAASACCGKVPASPCDLGKTGECCKHRRSLESQSKLATHVYKQAFGYTGRVTGMLGRIVAPLPTGLGNPSMGFQGYSCVDLSIIIHGAVNHELRPVSLLAEPLHQALPYQRYMG